MPNMVKIENSLLRYQVNRLYVYVCMCEREREREKERAREREAERQKGVVCGCVKEC